MSSSLTQISCKMKRNTRKSKEVGSLIFSDGVFQNGLPWNNFFVIQIFLVRVIQMSLQVMKMMMMKMMMMTRKEKTKVFELCKQCFYLLTIILDPKRLLCITSTGISGEQDSVIHQTSCFVFFADEQKMEIIDHTETNLVALRRTIYLTIQSRYSEDSFTIVISN